MSADGTGPSSPPPAGLLWKPQSPWPARPPFLGFPRAAPLIYCSQTLPQPSPEPGKSMSLHRLAQSTGQRWPTAPGGQAGTAVGTFARTYMPARLPPALPFAAACPLRQDSSRPAPRGMACHQHNPRPAPQGRVCRQHNPRPALRGITFCQPSPLRCHNSFPRRISSSGACFLP